MPVTAKATFLQAIKTLYDSVGSGTPTIYLDEVPEGVGYPRAIMRHGGEVPVEPPEWNVSDGFLVGSEAFATIDLINENSSDTVETLAIAVMRVFLPDAIQLTMDSNARMFRVSYNVGSRGRSQNDKPLFGATISYRALFGTNY